MSVCVKMRVYEAFPGECFNINNIDQSVTTTTQSGGEM